MYPNNVGAPPGPPQWGGQPSAAQQPQPVQLGTGRVNEWNRGVPEMQPPQSQSQQPSPYEQRVDSMRAPPPRHPSPRQDSSRSYHDPSRQTPSRKAHSPSPKLNPAVPGMYPSAPQTLPQLNAPDRGGPFGVNGRPGPPNGNGSMNGPAPPQGNALPPYGRPFSPQPEIRPIRDERAGSPLQNYQSQPYNLNQHFSSIANGAPPPAAAQTAADAAARERDERPPSAMKRMREWDSESAPSKKPASDEARARLDDIPRRPSPSGRLPSPREFPRRSSSEIRRENERRAHENYHPSEAAHRPQPLTQTQQQIPSMHTLFDTPKEERKEQIEPAARKVEVDEDYDNNSEDDKRNLGSMGRNSPQSNIRNGAPKQEVA